MAKKTKSAKEVLVAENRLCRKVKFHLTKRKANSLLSWRLQWSEPIKGIKSNDRGDKQFHRRQEAEEFVKNWQRDEMAQAGEQNMRPTFFTLDQLKDAEYASSLLPENSTLSDAVWFFAKHTPKKTQTVSKAFSAWMQENKEDNLRAATIRDRRSRMKSFVADLSDTLLVDLTEKVVKPYIVVRNRKPRNQISYHLVFGTFFSFCIRKKWLKISPIEDFRKPKTDVVRPSILTIEEVQRLVSVASEHDEGALLAYFAILLFCGLRPSEVHDGLMHEKADERVQPLEWEDLVLEEGDSQILLDRSKGRRPRNIPIPENARQLLLKVMDKPLFPPKKSRAHFEAICKKANISWKADICRHSWASHLYAKNGDSSANLIARVAGNSQRILEKHYLRALSRKQGVEYFKIGMANKLKKK
jgi:integrase